MKKIKEKSYKKYKYLILVAGILTLFPIFSISSDIDMSKNLLKFSAEYDYILYGGSNVILSGLPLEFFTILYYAAAISILTQFSENYKTK